MRKPALPILAAAALLVLGALTSSPATAQGDQSQTPSPPKAYKALPVKLPQPVSDASFEAFRKQLTTIAGKKDRAALAQVMAPTFFWIPENDDVADKSKSPIDNFAKALGLDGNDAPGWDTLASFGGETTADPLKDPKRQGVICGPGLPVIDEKAFEALIKVTQTDPAEWGYPSADGIEVHAGAEPNTPVTEKLGLHLIRAYPDDSPAGTVHNEVIRIVTPSGKLGFMPIELLLPLAGDQLCYSKQGGAWKIAGVIGGGTPQQ
jgi:hypothetical protein